jgi:mono/diheme cytochrome c family protein
MKALPILVLGLGLVWAQSDKKPNPETGRAIFESKCSECHDPDTEDTKVGPGLKGIKNGKLPSGKQATHDNVLEILLEGRDEMPPFKDVLTDQQKDDVIAYVLTL